MKRLKKIFFGFIIFIVVFFTLVYIFISPVAKYVIEKNSIQWLGRRITIGKINIRLFNGTVYIKDIKLSETDSSKVFFECHDVYLKVSLKKMLAKIYDVEEVRFDEPQITINQNGNKFNFDDLSERFDSKRSKDDTVLKAPPSKFYLRNIKIVNGNITYNNVPVHNTFKIHNINFNCPEFAWNTILAKLHLDFKYGIGGNFNIDALINRKTFEYNVTLQVDTYDLSQYYAPLNSFIKISSLKGSFSTKLRMHGEFNTPKEFSLVGYLHVNDVEVKDSAKKKLFALGELLISVDTINVKHNQYVFHTIMLDKPYMVFNDYANGNNISQMIKPQEHKELKERKEKKDSAKDKSKLDYSNIFTLLASSAKAMTADYLNSNYHADSIAIHNGEFVFNDNTPDNKFHYKVSKINIVAHEVGVKNNGVTFSASALLNDTGKFNLQAGILYDLRKKTFDYKITSLGIHHISPIVKYVIEKYDMQWIGRQITIGHISVNAMNGSVNIKDIKMYEANSDNVFFDCHDFFVKLDLQKLFNGVYGIDTI
jgi:uncharacterized protein involved in outer membrane biogenesis